MTAWPNDEGKGDEREEKKRQEGKMGMWSERGGVRDKEGRNDKGVRKVENDRRKG